MRTPAKLPSLIGVLASVALVCGCGSVGIVQDPPAAAITPVSFAARTDMPTNGTKPASVALADFNGDGKLDIAVSNVSSNTIAVFLNRGDGTFESPILTPVQVPIGLGAIVEGDFNQDGKPDLVAATIAGPQSDIVMLGNGDGTFSQQPSIPNSFGFIRSRAADLNGDGHLDLVDGRDGSVAVTR